MNRAVVGSAQIPTQTASHRTTTPSLDAAPLAQIADTRRRADSVLLVAHVNPDADAPGSTLATAIPLEHLGVTLPDDPLEVPATLKLLPGQCRRTWPFGARCAGRATWPDLCTPAKTYIAGRLHPRPATSQPSRTRRGLGRCGTGGAPSRSGLVADPEGYVHRRSEPTGG
jgi:hypothetical protein